MHIYYQNIFKAVFVVGEGMVSYIIFIYKQYS
jgi:hypothetical protein